MIHCFVDRDAQALPSWLEAFPEARVVRRDAVPVPAEGELRVIWCRCRPQESLASILGALTIAPSQIVVVLADEPGDAIIAEACALGASGCCNTYAAPEVLRQVALVVENGGLWIGQSLLQRLVGSTARALEVRPEARVDTWSALLSERESQVAKLVAGGASNKEIADQLSITERTVKAHLSAVFEKLALRDRLQLSLRINGVNL
ncbi:helix-turn-helix transcriptional regulator [Ferribacterium limneticum]|uniref:helix-turn-helix transcriptional regulator n=1 Tax=Ferribacterium limneticum TaxID=76259 RepID=UPI001CFBE28C|nr:response regulator transcription factor [Ferribacterium limneticum]UCV20304.1 response regulator transcription factor [Ferribacterium limneticum]